MRKWNSVIGVLILVLFLFHGITGALQLGAFIPGGSTLRLAASVVMMVLIAVHVGIGVKLTADTIRARQPGTRFYARENRLFLARRISGFGMLILIVLHVLSFTGNGDGGALRLPVFGRARLILHLLLAADLLIHVLTNVEPLLIGLGISSKRTYLRDIFFVLSVVIFLMAVSFVFYYLRWFVLWR